ncbi:hypothetical protein AX16_003839 [Volvariella volvacea WC 439]|nr:hypothetical protein AX16_003839 [Volvariella volvacea WC 439]
MSPTVHRTPSQVVIIGGGIIGCTTAYYLSRHPSYSPSQTRIAVIEASAIGPAQGASGKAGGLVARWAYPKQLVNISFPEHVKLAEEHDGAKRWGFRFVSCGSWEGRGEDSEAGELRERSIRQGEKKSLEKKLGLEEFGGGRSDTDDDSARRASKGLPHDLLWVKEELTDSYTPLAKDGDTAQVHPYLFTTSMLSLAQERGVDFIKGRVTQIKTTDGQVTGVEYLDRATEATKSLDASHILLAAGAWSSAPALLPALPISGTRAHSITIQPQPSAIIAPYVLFTEISIPMPHSRRLNASPEIYARPDNEVYACGPGDNPPLPDCVDDVVVDQEACETIRHQVSSISEELKNGQVTRRQACFLPNVSTGGGNPIIGEAVNVARGLYVATGHTCWGICNAPGTALAMTELIMEGKIKSANLSNLSPSHYF